MVDIDANHPTRHQGRAGLPSSFELFHSELLAREPPGPAGVEHRADVVCEGGEVLVYQSSIEYQVSSVGSALPIRSMVRLVTWIRSLAAVDPEFSGALRRCKRAGRQERVGAVWIRRGVEVAPPVEHESVVAV